MSNSRSQLINVVMEMDDNELDNLALYLIKENIIDSNELDDNMLDTAIERNNENIVKFLINKNADVNKHNIFSQTALYKAINMKNKNIISILINAKANVNYTDINGLTPLHWLAGKGTIDFSIVDLLIEAKADPTIQNEYGNSIYDFRGKELTLNEILKYFPFPIAGRHNALHNLVADYAFEGEDIEDEEDYAY